MGELGSPEIFEFARFRFDRRGHCLYRLDKAGEMALLPAGRTALDILGLLVERAGQVVESEEIRRTVWRGKTVEDANLATQIFHLRESVGRDRIQTVSGRGYRFVGPVTRLNDDARSATSKIPQSEKLTPRLSIVVLPFTNFSDDGEQQYFADGIAADPTTDLSRLADMFVISRHTAFTYRDKRPVDTKEIGRALGVRYVLDGSVRRSGIRSASMSS